MKHSVISVLGAGAYGTALAITLSRFGNPVTLWGHRASDVKRLKEQRENKKYLPGILFPASLHIEADLAQAVAASQNILVVVPSHAFSQTIKEIKPYLTSLSRIVWATKGLEPESGRLFSTVIQSLLGEEQVIAVISGPTFAGELAQGLPTAIDIASNNAHFSERLQQLFHTSHNLTAYNYFDIIGVQLGGVIKNVIAIGVGISDGVGYGANARISLITRGMSEMMTLGIALGANRETFKGMSGLGDLILTCTDNQSRNRRFGLLVGEGHKIEHAHHIVQHVVEGYLNTKEVWALARKCDIKTPIIDEIYNVLYCHKDPKLAAISFFNYDKEQMISGTS